MERFPRFDTPPEDVPPLIYEYDRHLGAFMRNFATAELLLTMLYCKQLGVSVQQGGFLTEKLGAGQKLDLVRKFTKANWNEDLLEFTLEMLSAFSAINDFRVLISHKSMTINKGIPTLMSQGPSMSVFLDRERDVSTKTLGAQIESLKNVGASIQALMIKIDTNNPQSLNDLKRERLGTVLK